jgi:integrase
VVVGPNPTPPAITSTHYLEFLKTNMREVTAKCYVKRLKFLAKLGNIDNPEEIKTIICNHKVSEGRKELLAYSYDYYCQYMGLVWKMPKFTREDKPIFLPLGSELDALISNTGEKMSVFLQLLKETGVDPGEAWKLRWIDIDTDRRTVAVTPTKNHS